MTMDDIVSRARSAAHVWGPGAPITDLLCGLADEVEDLRAACRELTGIHAHWRLARDERDKARAKARRLEKLADEARATERAAIVQLLQYWGNHASQPSPWWGSALLHAAERIEAGAHLEDADAD